MAQNYVPAPAPKKQASQSNYLDFTTQSTSAADLNWAQQYVPDLIEQEAEVFGNRTISGFLNQVGAEEAMQADQVVWSEQGRLHLSYEATVGDTGTTLTVSKDADGRSTTDHGVRVGDMLMVSSSTSNAVIKCYVTKVADEVITVKPYTLANLNTYNAETVKIMVFGSEFVKGSAGRVGANEPGFKSFTNNPIIIKDKYEISGSDTSQIGWVEVTGEEGQSGYLWYLKASGDTRARFNDYLEMVCIEAEKVAAASSTLDTADTTEGASHGVLKGTEGLFAALNARGNTNSTDMTLDNFDGILKEFDKQGAIEENMMFLDRTSALAVDDMLSQINHTSVASSGTKGVSFGAFDNSADMALNLGFTGFRRGSYDFYKSDWKYLNDLSTRGIINENNTAAVRGVIVPAGVSSVYDQNLGKNLKRPFLHVRYRASQTESRQYKTWTTGSVGAVTSDLDMMEMHYLSERCLIVQGANNFVLLN
tara:strand:+ start:760 stop:2193 length:1434 start_codon:yes stop_codon:yes gene_type:complete